MAREATLRDQGWVWIAAACLVAPVAVSVGGARDLPVGVPAGDAPDLAVQWVVGFREVPEDLSPGDVYGGGIVLRVDAGLEFATILGHPAAILGATQDDPNVRYAEPDVEYVALVTYPNDASLSHQYGPQQVRGPEAWDSGTGTTDKNVCVVDTGVRYTHEELSGSRWLGGTDFVNGDDDPWDDNGHGTHVAGIAAAAVENGVGIAGMANVGILAVKVLNGGGSGSASNVASGIEWCADHAGHVINLSLGSASPSSAIEDAVNYAWDQGSLVVAAAGNSGPCSNCISYPARYVNSIAVTCTDVTVDLCYFSSTGPQADLAAPGHGILSAAHSGDDDYVILSGTSMSAPLVAGVAALVWTLRPTLSTSELRSALEDTAADLGVAGSDSKFGHGLVDAQAALDLSSLGAAPDFSFSPLFPKTGQSVQFTGSAALDGDAVASWLWDFGDGATSADQSPAHSYADANLYPVTLTITDDDGQTTVRPMKVPVASEASCGTSGSPVGLSAGVPIFAAPPTSSTDACYYTVTVPSEAPTFAAKEWTPGGSDRDLYVRFNAAPDGGFDCRPFSNAADEVCWMPDPSAGTWWIKVQNWAQTTQEFVVLPLLPTGLPSIVVDFSFSPLVAKPGQFVQFTDKSETNAGSLVTWDWDFGDGGASSSRNPSHAYADTGVYSVELTVTNSASNGGTTMQLVSVLPGAACGTAAQPTLLVVGDLVVASPTKPSTNSCYFTVQVPHGAESLTIEETTPNGTDRDLYMRRGANPDTSPDCSQASAQPDETCAFDDPVPDLWWVKVRNFAQVNHLFTVGITAEGDLNQLPIADFSTDPLVPLAGQPVTFTDLSTDADGTIEERTWSFGDGTPSATDVDPLHTFANPGTYSVVLSILDDLDDPGSIAKSVVVVAAARLTLGSSPAEVSAYELTLKQGATTHTCDVDVDVSITCSAGIYVDPDTGVLRLPSGTYDVTAVPDEEDYQDYVKKKLNFKAGKDQSLMIKFVPNFVRLEVTIQNTDVTDYSFDVLDAGGVSIEHCEVDLVEPSAACDEALLEPLGTPGVFRAPDSAGSKWSLRYHAEEDLEGGAPDVKSKAVKFVVGATLKQKVKFVPNTLVVTVKGGDAASTLVDVTDALGRTYESGLTKGRATFNWVAEGGADICAEDDLDHDACLVQTLKKGKNKATLMLA